MQRTSRAVRLVADSGAVIIVNPDLNGGGEPITLTVGESADMVAAESAATVTLDGETADAIDDAIDEARGRRKRQRGTAAGS
jgi:hypothetical protein